MAAPDHRQNRFERVKEYLERLTEWATVSRDDSTLVVDTGELELLLRRYGKALDELLDIPPTQEHKDRIASKIAYLMAEIDGIRMTCDDLKGPLDRLLSKLYDDDHEELQKDS